MGHALPLLGHLPAFWTDTNGFLLRLAREQGDVATFRLGPARAFLLSHPDHVRRVLVDDAALFRKGRLMRRARRLLGEGLLTSEGRYHDSQRRRIQPAFCRRQLERYGDLVPPLAAAVAERWETGQIYDIGAVMDQLSLAVTARTLLGADLDREAAPLAADLRLLARRAALFALPLARWLERAGLPPFRRAGRAAGRVESAVLEWIRERPPALGLDLLAVLGRMTRPAARDEAMTIFLAGHDTTAAALTWAWHLLATHPDVARRLERELDEVLGDRDPVAADCPSLVYTAAVLEETLRLYPPIGRIGRRPVADYGLDGHRIPAGAAVFLSPFVTQRDPRWWPDPERFDPGRWTAERIAARPRYAAFPFGAGPRSCIGGRMAQMVGVLTIATIARRWRMLPTGGLEPRIRGLLTLKPAGPIRLLLARRAAARHGPFEPRPGAEISGVI